MSIESIIRTIVVGHHACCGTCGTTGPLAQTIIDAIDHARAAGWEINSEGGTSYPDYCPRCYDEREAALDRKHSNPEGK